ncbi:MAG: gamma-glutamyl-gamma-aminobutyrate hydrolase family protein [Bdellovibrionales bacterium]|nr:gamma-glutamyl-gamma-aminobutyrate hydrolase family protein [Bdellovibrionales bacterium]
MRVAITQRHLTSEVGADRDALEHDYLLYYPRFGMTMVPISNVCEDLEAFFGNFSIEGIFLSGGNAVHPSEWGESEVLRDNAFSAQRSSLHKRLIELAIKLRIPTIGICTGLHAINVHFGGTLTQDMSLLPASPVSHVGATHRVSITASELAENLGRGAIVVNSFHHQGIRPHELAPVLRSWATCLEDGSVEGVYHPDLPIAAMVWHPERPGCDEDCSELLVRAFLKRTLFWKQD